ncbi:hypothetical protein [Lewinella cohaerens]|uniref:hypothetical protein n=1 Tax=Lewinella cohaerens TaxID=70995 RepID=UPI00037347C0|nr:hypothetical protein [Lewinella cohaerens]
MSKAEAVKGGIEAADSLYELAKKFAGDVVIPGKGLVVAIRNWTKYTFSLNYKVKRGMIMNTNGSTLHPYSQEYHGEHHEFLFKGKANSGCSVVMEINKSEQE